MALKEGMGKILVHCSAGISRSPMAVTAYLMKRRGMTLKAALGQIVRVWPQVSPNGGFAAAERDGGGGIVWEQLVGGGGIAKPRKESVSFIRG